MSEHLGQRASASERLWALIPSWTRSKDRDAGGVLEGLVRALGVGIGDVRDDTSRLLADMFVDTCAEELIPLIGDLVGESVTPEIPAARQRYQVKQALHWRRRKGTPAQLEALAWIISGFPAELIEPVSGDVVGQAPQTMQIIGSSPAHLGTTALQITGTGPLDAIRIILSVVWPVRRREITMVPLLPGGPDLHAINLDADVGLRRSDGTPIFRDDDPRELVGPGLDIDVVGVGADLGHLGHLHPRFVDLGGKAPPQVPDHVLAIDPLRGRVAGPTAVIGSLMRMRRYQLRHWEPMLAEQVTATPRHLGDGVYSFASDGAPTSLIDEQANRLVLHHPGFCSDEGRRIGRAHRAILAKFGEARGCCPEEHAPYVIFPAGVKLPKDGTIPPGSLELDVAGLRRFFSIEDEWGWDIFAKVLLVNRFSREAPPDDTVEVDLRSGRFRVGPMLDSCDLRVRYYRLYDVERIRSRVREELLRSIPLGRQALIQFKDTPVPGYTARKI